MMLADKVISLRFENDNGSGATEPKSFFTRREMIYSLTSWVTVTQLNAIVVIDLRIQFLVVTLAFMLWIVRTKP